MKINIYGVGRSGTKAVQSYICYQLAKIHGKVWINYEPYYYYSRFGDINFNSFWYHYKLPHFITPPFSINKQTQSFFKHLTHHKDIPIVSKFIRGNGRASMINTATSPTISIVIIRDIYQVIGSILGETWDYYRLGALDGLRLSRIDYYDKIFNDYYKNKDKDNIYELAKQNITSKNRVLKNAMYWYWMNKHILSIKLDNTIFINYDDLKQLPFLLNKRFPALFPKIESIYDKKFNGTLFHTETFLKTRRKKTSKYNNIINELSFYAFGRLFKFSPTILKSEIGEISYINETKEFKVPSKIKDIKPIIPNNHIMDEMNNEIFNLLRKIKLPN